MWLRWLWRNAGHERILYPRPGSVPKFYPISLFRLDNEKMMEILRIYFQFIFAIIKPSFILLLLLYLSQEQGILSNTQITQYKAKIVLLTLCTTYLKVFKMKKYNFDENFKKFTKCFNNFLLSFTTYATIHFSLFARIYPFQQRLLAFFSGGYRSPRGGLIKGSRAQPPSGRWRRFQKISQQIKGTKQF